VPSEAQVGDILLGAYKHTTTLGTADTPAGYTLISTSSGSTGVGRIRTWAKVAVAGDLGATVTVVLTGTEDGVILFGVWNDNGGTPGAFVFDQTDQDLVANPAQVVLTSSAATGVTQPELEIIVTGARSGLPMASTIAFTPDSQYTLVASVNNWDPGVAGGRLFSVHLSERYLQAASTGTETSEYAVTAGDDVSACGGRYMAAITSPLHDINKNRYTKRRFSDIALPYDLRTIKLGAG